MTWSTIIYLMILTYSGSETDSLFENISTESFNSEWEEYDDRFEYWWDYLVSPLELRNALLFDHRKRHIKSSQNLGFTT
jgi:hypothetical protein